MDTTPDTLADEHGALAVSAHFAYASDNDTPVEDLSRIIELTLAKQLGEGIVQKFDPFTTSTGYEDIIAYHLVVMERDDYKKLVAKAHGK